MKLSVVSILQLICIESSSAFVVHRPPVSEAAAPLQMGGFGGSAVAKGGKKGKKKAGGGAPMKLRAKGQWDR